MRRRAVILATGLMMAASVAFASPAAAQQWICAGTQQLGYVCVDPTGGTLYDDCVYVGPPPCTPVTVPGPIYGCGGPLHCS